MSNLNKKDIENLLPHREPMLLIDELINIKKLFSATAIVNVKKNDEILRNKEKKLIAQKNILSQEDFQKELSSLRKEIINFQKEQVKARDDINKLRIGATNKLISQLSPILQEYAKKNSVSLILQKKNIVMGKKEIEITDEILSLTDKQIKDIKIN